MINGDCFQEEIILWDIATGKPSGQHLTIDMELYSSRGEIIFSPDSKTIVSTIENSLYLWNVESHQSIGRPLTLNSNGLSSFGFIQNGKLLVTTSLWANFNSFTQTARILLWDMDPESWIKKSCERAGRNFTRAEWERYFPNEEYHQTCEQWPLEAEPTPAPTATPVNKSRSDWPRRWRSGGNCDNSNYNLFHRHSRLNHPITNADIDIILPSAYRIFLWPAGHLLANQFLYGIFSSCPTLIKFGSGMWFRSAMALTVVWNLMAMAESVSPALTV